MTIDDSSKSQSSSSVSIYSDQRQSTSMSSLHSPSVTSSLATAATNISRSSKGFLADLGSKRSNFSSKVARRISRSVSSSAQFEMEKKVQDLQSQTQSSAFTVDVNLESGPVRSPSVASFATTESTGIASETRSRNTQIEEEEEFITLEDGSRSTLFLRENAVDTYISRPPEDDQLISTASKINGPKPFNYSSQVSQPIGSKHRNGKGSSVSQRSPSISSTIFHSITSSFSHSASSSHSSTGNNVSLNDRTVERARSRSSSSSTSSSGKFRRGGSLTKEQKAASPKLKSSPLIRQHSLVSSPILNGDLQTSETTSYGESSPRTPKARQNVGGKMQV